MATEITWRFLIVDDKQANEVKEFIGRDNLLDSGEIVVEICEEFSEAINKLELYRIDLIILDLKDDSIDLEDENKPFAGEKVFDQIRQHRFVPVIFHTAYAHKVRQMGTPFVQVVSRDDPRRLRGAIKDIFDTGLPQLIRHLEVEQREYMWDHVQNYWQDMKTRYERTDLTYLLARRLANTLERNSIRRFLTNQQDGGPGENDETIHPVEMYIYPPTNPKWLAGDILKGCFYNRKGHWIVMTPSCDLAQGKVTDVVLAACFLLIEQPEFIKIQNSRSEGKAPSNNLKRDLEDLIGNNRNAKYEDKRFQPERYNFLPGTFFLPDLVIDYQSLIQISLKEINIEDRVASLDSPFAEACLARFARYYGRLGTPDIDKALVYNRVLDANEIQ